MKEIAEENLFATSPEIENLKAEIDNLETEIEIKTKAIDNMIDKITDTEFKYNELSQEADNLKTKKLSKIKKLFFKIIKIVSFGGYNHNQIIKQQLQKKQIAIAKLNSKKTVLLTNYENTNAKRKNLIAKVTTLYEKLKEMTTKKNVDININVNQYPLNSKQTVNIKPLICS